MWVKVSNNQVVDIESSLLLLMLYEDEIPLKGTVGIVDWNECNAISRLVKKGIIKGTYGERTLYAPTQMLRSPRVLLVGLGKKKEFSYFKIFKLFKTLSEVILRMNVADLAISLPSINARDFRCYELIERMLSGIIEGQIGIKPNLLEVHTITFVDDDNYMEEIALGLQKVKVDYIEKLPITIHKEKTGLYGEYDNYGTGGKALDISMDFALE